MTSNLTSRKAFGVPSSASSRSHTQINIGVACCVIALRCVVTVKSPNFSGVIRNLPDLSGKIIITNIVFILFIPLSAVGGRVSDRF